MTAELSVVVEDVVLERDYWRQEADRLRNSRDRLIDYLSTGSDLWYETGPDLRIKAGKRATGGTPARPGFAAVDTAIAELFTGKTIFEVVGDNPAMRATMEKHREDTNARQPFRGMEYSITLADGRVVWMETGGNPYYDAQGKYLGYRGATRDITRRKTDEALIEFMVRHDPLTKLANRILLKERIDEALQYCRAGSSTAVLCLDLDRFKLVNDTLGHAVGDILLKTVAERLLACVASRDTVARIGGDEFVVVKRDVGRPEELIELAGRVVKALTTPVSIDGHQVSVGTGIGIALSPADGQDAEVLVKNADIALYRSKIEGSGSWRFFEPEMAERLKSRRDMENDLRDAVARNELELFYQPVVNIATGKVTGFEALLRWRHPRRGLVSPDEFIPMAEETGLIVPIGEWVLRSAMSDASRWPEDVGVAVNLSAAQFRSPRLIRAVKEALDASGLAASRLELEITESVLIRNVEAVTEVLEALHAMGIRVAMDDFGTGCSSLGYLRSFHFDRLKIDRSFIHDLSRTDDSAAIVRAIAGIGASLHLAITAEGVETREQLAMLRAEGCTEVQGYFFSRPVPFAETGAMVDPVQSSLRPIPCATAVS